MATRRGRASKPAETAPVQEDTVTDINETATDETVTEGQEPEAGTAEAGHTFNVGDEARVIRGKLRGQNGKILAYWPEAGTAEAGHTFNVGDEARVIRGKLRGQNGKILAYSKTDNTYAITLESGTLATVNAGNLKAPADSTVSVAALVSVLSSFQFADADEANRLAAALDAVAPGVSAKLNEASAS